MLAETDDHSSVVPPFDRYTFGRAYDEMFEAHAAPRPHYRALHEHLLTLPVDELERRQQVADRAFLHQGITFTVYADSRGTERIFPYDLLPRIIPAPEWQALERGLAQRITALNLFLRDIYRGPHPARWHRAPRTHPQLPALPARDAWAACRG